jgi:hypothetical protein
LPRTTAHDRVPPSWNARLSTAGSPVCAPDWLALREPADAAARASVLVEQLNGHLRAVHPAGTALVVRDLGCGTGSMARWLAGRLPDSTSQHWVLHDRDPVLLDRAAASLPAGVTGETCPGDLTDLDAGRLAGTSLVTCSALLDLLTGDEVEDIAEAVTTAGCPALLTLSVAGSVSVTPADPLDDAFAAAFDAHQRRTADGRRLLGPDAAVAAAAAFERRGARVTTAPSDWRLGPAEAELAQEWLRGWIEAACVQRPELRAVAGECLRRRLTAAEAGELRVVVRHRDLLALPAGDPRGGRS